MRVISGFLKGREIKGYDIEGTRPTMDRVKESVFGSIQNYIDESVCLDLFAGSGNLGIECISNGASICYFVDNNKIAINVINDNISKFDIKDKSVVIKDDYNNALNLFKEKGIKFDLIFLDPPYRFDYINNIVKYISKNGLLNDNGLIICEFENDIDKEVIGLRLLKEKKYGYKKVIIFKKD
ncbi:MAG: 16S rRNA (guanine(966)-N(2))-methyltransferase RsmD [Bacilli bacterium]|nr:16S rRNA (guanine(966)-N(2))-methyltransferase RsmD [Bacilli bacterium]